MFAAQDRRLRVWAPASVPFPEPIGHTTGPNRIAPRGPTLRLASIAHPRGTEASMRLPRRERLVVRLLSPQVEHAGLVGTAARSGKREYVRRQATPEEAM